MNKTDLHIHSKCSNDGEYGVPELIEKCINNQITTFAITDHNSIAAISEAIPLCLNAGIDFVSGIDI